MFFFFFFFFFKGQLDYPWWGLLLVVGGCWLSFVAMVGGTIDAQRLDCVVWME